MKNRKHLLLMLPLLLLGMVSCNESKSEPLPSEITDNSDTQNTSKDTTAPLEETAIESTPTTEEGNVSTESKTSESVSITDKDIFVVGSGYDSVQDGSYEHPCSIEKAILNLKPGGTIYLLEGTYKCYSTIMIALGNNGTADNYKTIAPYNGAKVIFDFSGMSFNSANRGISINGNYWHLKDVEITSSGDNGIYIGGNYNIVENCVTHDCSDTGIQLGRAKSSFTSIDQWPHDNLIKNCTSYDNHDPSGEDSDGFACKLTTGVNNVFDGCIAYNNVDDGWDLYSKGDTGPIGAVTIKNCVAFNNGRTTKGVGTSNSDGNGFKLGGEGIAVSHTVINSVAFNNLACGFTDNSNPGTISMTACTSYNNGVRDADAINYSMCRDEKTSINNFKDVFSYCSGNKTNPITNATTIANSKDEYKGTVEHSVFYSGLTMLKFDSIQACDYTVESKRGTVLNTTEFPFVSVTAPDKQADLHSLLRNADGSVNLGDFLKIKSGTVFATMSSTGSSIGANLHN